MRKKEYNINENISLEDFQREAFKYQLEMMKDVLIPDQNVLNLIKSAKTKGIKVAVATSSEKQRAIKMLRLV